MMEPFTDRERVEQAFTALRIEGWYAAGPLACCQSCGVGEALAAMEDEPTLFDKGYVFFHDQDDEGSFDEDGQLVADLNLSYGVGPLGHEPDRIEVCAGVAVVARRFFGAGLRFEWNGRPDTRLRVPPFEDRDRFFQFRDEEGLSSDEASERAYGVESGRALSVTYDVSGLDEAEVDALEMEAVVQGESSERHGQAMVVSTLRHGLRVKREAAS
jgi:hypothetical protein